MIAVDTSSMVAYLRFEEGHDQALIDEAISAETLRLPPVVMTELLSFPKPTPKLGSLVASLPPLEIVDGFWQRAGSARRLLLGKGLKAKLADALIAQSCIDADVALITRDCDFRHFADLCGLRLA